MRLVVGVDPGAAGAIAAIDADSGALLWVEDMPVDVVVVAGTERPRVSDRGLAALLRPLPPAQMWIEQVGAAPGQGRSSAFTFGYGAGKLPMAAAALGWPEPKFVIPAVWKRVMQCPADKEKAVALACQLFPNMINSFTRVNRKKATVGIDGRAEAALIALYGVRRAS